MQRPKLKVLDLSTPPWGGGKVSTLDGPIPSTQAEAELSKHDASHPHLLAPGLSSLAGLEDRVWRSEAAGSSRGNMSVEAMEEEVLRLLPFRISSTAEQAFGVMVQSSCESCLRHGQARCLRGLGVAVCLPKYLAPCSASPPSFMVGHATRNSFEIAGGRSWPSAQRGEASCGLDQSGGERSMPSNGW